MYVCLYESLSCLLLARCDMNVCRFVLCINHTLYNLMLHICTYVCTHTHTHAHTHTHTHPHTCTHISHTYPHPPPPHTHNAHLYCHSPYLTSQLHTPHQPLRSLPLLPPPHPPSYPPNSRLPTPLSVDRICLSNAVCANM